MLTRPGVLALAAACFVGVVGWPIIAVILFTWLAELATNDLLWWSVGMVLSWVVYGQWLLTRALWRFLDPGRG